MLRVDPVHVDRVGGLDCLQRGGFGDLVKFDALGIFELQQFRQMPGDRLAFAIGVGREEHFGGRLRGSAQVLDHVALTFNREVTRGETVLDIHAERAFGEVPDVPDRCLYHVARGQKLLDRTRFCRRLDDDQRRLHRFLKTPLVYRRRQVRGEILAKIAHAV